jgi:geranylgeranyl pyrophosphate synthase
MATFGAELGVAFQILDDVLDVISDEATLGKKSGQDLRERKPSIINVLWLASGDPLAAPLLTLQSDSDDSWIDESLKALRSGKGLAGKSVAAARRMATEFVAGASTALDSALGLARQNQQSTRLDSGHASLGKEAEATLRSLMSYVLKRVS